MTALGYRSLAALAVALLLAACQGGKTAGGPGVRALPDLPRVASTLSSREAITYREMRITLEGIEFPEGRTTPVIHLSASTRRATETASITSGEYGMLHGYLVRAVDVTRTNSPEGSMARLHLWDLSRFMSGTSASRVEPVNLSADELEFLPNGFVASVAVMGNDPVNHRDDAVRLAWGDARGVRTQTLMEGQVVPFGDKIIRVRNVFPGEEPLKPVVALEVGPADALQVSSEGPREVQIISGVIREFGAASVTLEPLPSGEPRAFMTYAERGESLERLVRPGEVHRVGSLTLDIREIGVESSRVMLSHHPDIVLPEAILHPDARPVERDTLTMPESTIQTHRIRINDQVDFWDCQVQLARIYENSAVSLRDDIAEMVVTFDGRFQTVRLGEGQRTTIHGSRRWWVIDVRAIRAGTTPNTGEATIQLHTGTFLVLDEPQGRR